MHIHNYNVHAGMSMCKISNVRIYYFFSDEEISMPNILSVSEG